MRIPLAQIDAFTDTAFRGNPAAVCVLESWLPDALLQSIALENNLSETAFVVRDGDAWHLRWFTPTLEVDLCGHATLATSHWLFERVTPDESELRFRTRSGELLVRRGDAGLTMNFPSLPPEPAADAPDIVAALRATPDSVHSIGEVHGGAYYMAVFARQADIAALAPDTARLGSELHANVICTARGEDVDFVSRFFAPASGVPEDPVTGSAHCTLAPYWAEVLGRNPLRGRQISARGGDVGCEVRGDRVLLTGRCVTYMVGEIEVPT